MESILGRTLGTPLGFTNAARAGLADLQVPFLHTWTLGEHQGGPWVSGWSIRVGSSPAAPGPKEKGIGG